MNTAPGTGPEHARRAVICYVDAASDEGDHRVVGELIELDSEAFVVSYDPGVPLVEWADGWDVARLETAIRKIVS